MKFTPLNDRLHNYLLSVTLREHPLLKELRHETANYARGNMQIAPEQGQLMALLIQMMIAKISNSILKPLKNRLRNTLGLNSLHFCEYP
jgi:predicted O-methyltransferase YrrM